MINEFYAALLNENAQNNSVGADYVPASWSTRHLRQEAAQLRRCLLVAEVNPAGQNWRASELRRLVEGSDLSSMLTMIDDRTGYLPSKIQESMVRLFTPRFVGPLTATVKGKYKAPHYVLSSWEIETDLTDVTITGQGTSQSTPLGSGDTVRIAIPGTDAHLRVSTDTNSFTTLTWAAVPTTNLAVTAKSLQNQQFANVKALTHRDSVFPLEDREMLVGLVERSETPTVVAAATLLLVGHILAI